VNTVASPAFAMAVPEKPLSANRGRPSPRYTGVIQRAATAAGARVLAGPLYARIVWFQLRPAEGDVDNIAKLILDSLKGVVIHDDDEIVRCLAQKTVADMNGLYAYDPLLIPSTTVPTELAGLLGVHDHVLYIEIGAVTDPTVTFGPVA
jgi:hypothetical protein